MGLLSRRRERLVGDIAGQVAEQLAEQRDSWNWEITDSAALARYLNQSVNTTAGAKVNATTALASSAVAAVVGRRMKTMGALPAHCFESTDKGPQPATMHPVQMMMRNGIDETLTWPQFMRKVELCKDFYGNDFYRNHWRGGRLVRLEPLDGVMEIARVNGKVVYTHRPLAGGEDIYGYRDITHFKSHILTPDGLYGRSLVDVAKESIGLDMTFEEFAGYVMANGMHLGTVLSTEQVLPKDAYDAMQKRMDDSAGVKKAAAPRLLQGGLKPVEVKINLKDMDLTDQRRFVNERVAAIFGVPLTLVNDLTHGTYTNSEQQDLQYSKHDITPDVVDMEAVMNRSWFASGEEGRLYVKLNLNGLERGDYKTRMEGYGEGIRNLVLKPAEARAFEDLPYDEAVDHFFAQAQMTPVEQLGQDPAAPLEPVVNDARERIRIRAAQDAERGRKPEDTREWARKVLEPLTLAHAAAGVAFDPKAVLDAALNGGN